MQTSSSSASEPDGSSATQDMNGVKPIMKIGLWYKKQQAFCRWTTVVGGNCKYSFDARSSVSLFSYKTGSKLTQ